MNDVDLQGVKNEASPPGKENKHFHIAPLDPVLKDGASALRQHFVRGERPGQKRNGHLVSQLIRPNRKFQGYHVRSLSICVPAS
jgi:hypothetical protein